MLRKISASLALAIFICAATNAYAQYPPPPGYGYGGGWGSPGTAASANMNGMANMVSAKGSYNLQTSQAAINMTQAQSQEIQNHQQYTDTYFSMRATNRAATEAERGPHPTMEQLTRMAAEGVPKPFSSDQMDPVSGSVAWPDVLQDDSFADQRKEVEGLLAKKAANGRLGFTDQTAMRKTCDAMFAQLKGMIKNVPSMQYIASRDFLQSLIFSTTKAELE